MATTTAPPVSPPPPRRRSPQPAVTKVSREEFWGEVIVPHAKTRRLRQSRLEGSHRWVLTQDSVTELDFDFDQLAKDANFVLVMDGTVRTYTIMGSNPSALADLLHKYHRRAS